MISRRNFLKLTGSAAASLAITHQVEDSLFKAFQAYAAEKIRVFSGSKPGTAFIKFVDPLPIIPLMPNAGMMNQYRIAMKQFAQKIHRDLPPTTLWGFGADGHHPSVPGETIEARINTPVKVQWINDLPSTHLLAGAVDHTIYGAEQKFPEVRTVVHLHGGANAPDSDGYPEDWYSPSGVRIDGRAGNNYVDYTYHNGQLPAALWYHDHVLGMTRLNIIAGLAGFYILRDDHDTGGPPAANLIRSHTGENTLGLPGPAPGHGLGPFYEIPLVIQDLALNADGSLFYPAKGINPEIHPQWVQDFFGDVMCVNGKAWPFLELEPRRYRFRILNACNSRVLDLDLDSQQPIFQIGSDGGLLPQAVKLQRLRSAPAERADIIIDFTGSAGAAVTLRNHARTPFIDGDLPNPETTGQIMQFRVARPRHGPDHSLPPSSMPLPASGDLRQLVTSDMLKNPRRAFLNVIQGPHGPSMLTLSNLRWTDPVTETPRIGSVEVWEIMNLANDLHPIHLHLIQCQLLNRQPFDVKAYKMALARQPASSSVPDPAPYLHGKPIAPLPQEAGWKDTIVHNPGEVTRIVTRWAPQTAPLSGPGSPAPGVNLYPFDPTRGKYVWHCHNLQHEDNEMMRPFMVLS